MGDDGSQTDVEMWFDRRAKAKSDLGQLEALADKLMEIGNTTLAYDVFNDIVFLQPRHTKARLSILALKMNASMRVQHRREYELTLDSIVQECRFNAETLVDLSGLYQKVGNVRGALRSAEKATKTGNISVTLLIRIAYLNYFMRKLRRTSKILKTLSLRPDITTRELRPLIELAFKCADHATAMALARRRVDLEPDILGHRVTLYSTMARASSPEKAALLLQTVIDDVCRTLPPNLILEAATVFRAAKRIGDELTLLLNAQKRFPGSEVISEALKVALWANSVIERTITRSQP